MKKLFKTNTWLVPIATVVLATTLIFVSCKKENEKKLPLVDVQNPLVDAQKTEGSGWDKMTKEEQEKILGDTCMKDHTDLNWELIKGGKLEQVTASHYISRCSAGNGYNATYMGQTNPGQGTSNACQSFAAAMAHNEYRYRKFGGTCINANPANWQRSPWHIYYNCPSSFYWTVSAPLNVLYNYGCTHLTCFPGYDGKTFFWAPDPQFGIYTLQDIKTKALNGNISDKSWSWVGGSNTTAIPAINCMVYNLDQNQIKNAINNGRVVLLRFALMDNGGPLLPVVYNYAGLLNSPVFNCNNSCGKNGLKYHIVAILGYDDALQCYRIQNSWGATNGMDGAGAFWMTYQTVTARADQAAYINW